MVSKHVEKSGTLCQKETTKQINVGTVVNEIDLARPRNYENIPEEIRPVQENEPCLQQQSPEIQLEKDETSSNESPSDLSASNLLDKKNYEETRKNKNCVECNLIFKTKEQINRHIGAHTRQIPLKCKKKFKTLRQFKKHMTKLHNKIPVVNVNAETENKNNKNYMEKENIAIDMHPIKKLQEDVKTLQNEVKSL